MQIKLIDRIEMRKNMKGEFEFSFESTARASYLVVRIGAHDKIINYQVCMIASNKIKRLANLDMKYNDGQAYCNYNITSMLSLSFFLERRKLSRNEFIRLLSDMAETLVDCEGYLLSGSSFLLVAEYVFINPETLDISMIYIPIDTGLDVGIEFKEFVVSLILKYADIDDGDDNFIQRILTCVKKNLFNLPEFLKLLDDLLYDTENSSMVNESSENQPVVGLHEVAVKDTKENSVYKKDVFNPVVIAVIAQIFLLLAVLLCVSFFITAGKNSVSNYAAVGLIVTALDVLLLKYLFKSKGSVAQKGSSLHNEEIRRRDTDTEKRSHTNKNNTNISSAKEEQKNFLLQHNVNEDLGRKEISAERNHDLGLSELIKKPDAKQNERNKYNTVLLAEVKSEYPILKSRNNNVSQDIVITKPDFLIGRLENQVDHICKSNAVGKVHAQIICDNGLYILKDLNSVNGTFINNCRIPCNLGHELKEGDNVAFANCEYIFEF